jgi:division protein CdvB (Snf7/Vps24/ESCRT-III family)
MPRKKEETIEDILDRMEQDIETIREKMDQEVEDDDSFDDEDEE